MQNAEDWCIGIDVDVVQVVDCLIVACHNPSAGLCAFLSVRPSVLHQVLLLVLWWDVVDVDSCKDLILLHAGYLFVRVCFELCLVVDDEIRQDLVDVVLFCCVLVRCCGDLVACLFVIAVMLFARLSVGDGSSVPGLCLAVSVDVLACLLACLLVLPSAMVSYCILLSGVVVLIFLCAMFVM